MSDAFFKQVSYNILQDHMSDCLNAIEARFADNRERANVISESVDLVNHMLSEHDLDAIELDAFDELLERAHFSFCNYIAQSAFAGMTDALDDEARAIFKRVIDSAPESALA